MRAGEGTTASTTCPHMALRPTLVMRTSQASWRMPPSTKTTTPSSRATPAPVLE